MKLKYKKAILLSILCTMGMGLLVISLGDSSLTSKGNNSRRTELSVMSVETNELKYKNSKDDLQVVITPQDVTLAPSATATPTPLPVYNLEKDSHPRITKLIEDYYMAMKNYDLDTLQTLVSDPAAVNSMNELKQISEYFDDYVNIEVYTKKGFIDGTYIVYAYYEIEIINIKTPVPCLSKLYVISDSNGDFKINLGTIKDKETKAYYEARNKDEDVLDLINLTNERYEEAKAGDEDLKNFCENLETLVNSSDSD
ncbi:MAG: hypothetical protein K0R00_3071 [Herbinix sp.]|jgi:hypothetical protein|nr:hypothetical protein [Herbinix sp.]